MRTHLTSSDWSIYFYSLFRALQSRTTFYRRGLVEAHTCVLGSLAELI